MRTLYLTTMIFCHILLSSFILYSAVTSASPLVEQPNKSALVEPAKDVVAVVKPHEPAAAPKVEPVAQFYKSDSQGFYQQEKDASLVQKSTAKQAVFDAPKSSVEGAEKKQEQPPKYVDQQQIVPKQESPPVVVVMPVSQEQPAAPVQQSPVAPFEQTRPELKVIPEKAAVIEAAQAKVHQESPKPLVEQAIPSLDDSVKERLVAAQPEPVVVRTPPAVLEIKEVAPQKVVVVSKQAVLAAPGRAANEPSQSPSGVPVVKGGLGPLHLLASTLCSYQPNKPVSDETLTYLYNQRAAQRKSLFQFMSLKFTNLDKLTAHLNAGLEVAKTVDSSESSLVRSPGWPAVGNCTAHYLKLMAEAAWCDCAEDQPNCLRDNQEAKQLQPQPQPRLARRSSGQQVIDNGAGLEERGSSVMSKLMYVGDVREAPLVEASQKTPVQPATLAPTRKCRRNALRMAKALFNHLAENQTEVSESWPVLRQQLVHDECARKRMIDIVSALSTFRGESTQVHRDNIEFAFAMDDLRGKVLENEVNTPLTFDKQVIEVEQFLQQSVRLMLANIDPKRAKLTSMRYRSLHAPVSADDQCIELHQRLLAKNYPDECNPNQYGPLPDVLRMAALSLELWSIEQDLAKYSPPASQQDLLNMSAVNECIANLVAS